ncbi:MAG: chromate transporter [Treponema sp.]|nr:chromate transporter [Treponema sp.]
MKEYWELFAVFLKMGVLTFGGGYAMIPVVERELINKRGWVDMDEVMDYYTVAQITPGIIAVNLSTFVGCKRGGILGGILTTLGFVLPGMCFITAIAIFLAGFADLPAVRHAFTGIRVAVCALIVDTVVKLIKGVFKNKAATALYAAAFALSAVWGLSPMALVAGAGILGLLIFRTGPDGGVRGAKKAGEGAPPADKPDESGGEGR